MDVISYMLGKNAGGGGSSATLQNSKNVTITENTTTTIEPDTGYDGLGTVEVTTNVTPNLQNKSLTITENTTTTIEPDTGYDGLESVSVTTNVSGSTTPTIGYVINSWDSDGYAADITTYGYTNIPTRFFYNYSSTEGNFINLNNINLNDEITSINSGSFANCANLTLTSLPSGVIYIYGSAFQNCTNLALTSLPSGLTTINAYVFYNCTNLAITSLPSGITTIGRGAFQNCTNLAITTIPDGVTDLSPASIFSGCSSLKKISFNNVTKMFGNTTSNSTFGDCTELKQVWIGSAITDSGIYRYTFYNCTNLEKMYIDLPRETVEAFTNYQYAFMNDTTKTGIIICNDDDDFIDKATFDAIDVSTL